MYQQRWGYKLEDKLYLGLREQKRLNTTELDYIASNESVIGECWIGKDVAESSRGLI
jgi:hypothetical protein